MANSVTTYASSLLMIILFTFAIIGFSVGFANDNNSVVRIDSDPNITSLYGQSQDSMGTFRDNADSTYASITNTTIESGSDVVKTPAAFTLSWGNLFSTFGLIMNVIFVVIFGGSSTFAIFITSVAALISFFFALYIIKAWRGNP